MVEDPYEEESDMEEDVMEMDESGEDDAEDKVEEDDVAAHFKRVLLEYDSDDDDKACSP